MREAACATCLWLGLMALLAGYRGLLLVVFRGSMSVDMQAGELARLFARGFRFDAVAASVEIIPLLIVTIVLCLMGRGVAVGRARAVYIWLLAAANTALALINIGFFHEYKDQFNHWIFNALHDDHAAVLKTIWAAYPVLLACAVFAILTAATSLGLVKLGACGERWAPRGVVFARNCWLRAIMVVVFLLLLLSGVRGSLGLRPVLRRDMAVGNSAFINSLVPNYIMALRYAVTDHLMAADPDQFPASLPNGDIRGALVTLHGEKARAARSIDELTVRVVKRDAGQPPRHVFLIIMEGGDMWPLLSKYESLGLMPELQMLAGTGVLFTRVVPAGDSTIRSLAPIITGLPQSGVHQNFQRLSKTPFPTSLCAAFKNLGYKTRLFYGGLLSWERLEAFATEQGFDEVIGGGSMIAKNVTWGEWGVPDRRLFECALERIPDEVPSLNVILTGSYHQPFNIDVAAENCAISEIPAHLRDAYDGGVPLRVFAHARYADRKMGEFIRAAEARFAKSLFAITGDHWSRRFLHARPTLYESRAVPFVLHGPQVLGSISGKCAAPGTHLDIAPTLIGLCAKAGFVHHTMGVDLLDEEAVAARPFAKGQDVVIMESLLFPWGNPSAHEHIEGAIPSDKEKELVTAAQRYADAWTALGWWRLMRGADIGNEKHRGERAE